MKIQIKILSITSLLLASSLAVAGSHPKWGYSDEEGPDHWASLSADFQECSGNNQSPVNLTHFIKSDLKKIKINYNTDGNEIVNNGHTIQINYAKGSSINIDGMNFELKQFHFHSPSENHINGKSYPLEAHFVHADKNANLAVIALMFDIGDENKTLDKAWSKMPQHTDDKYTLSNKVNADDLLPAKRDYYRFNGSLTTPPCSEGVRWFVMKEAVSLSKKQLGAFKSALHNPNNRPIQAVNARVILE
ncbi:Carbonic anhydrase, alpha class [hydrothermal vent metagenome]|uniref:carbonic anhydrase n=1 Tax=hydrothermal vent metagenome TaxID=652676 RepID=A0A3B0YAE2_9ZZZZ